MTAFKVTYNDRVQGYQLCDCLLVRDMEQTATRDLNAPRGSILALNNVPLMPYRTLKESKVTTGAILTLLTR